jgi:hypothetical protein
MLGGGVVAVIVAAAIAAVSIGSSGGPTTTDTDPAPPKFVDDTIAAGVSHTYDGEFEFFVGGGVAAFDCNDDGRHDLYFAGGSEPAALYRNESDVGGALRFAPQPSPVTDLTAVTGAYPLDIDSDGITDLVVLRRGANSILRGLGNCRFEPAIDRFGIDPGAAWTTAFSATWEASNRLPTLAFGNYLTPESDPNEVDCDDSQFVRPTANGDAYATAVSLRPGYCTLSMLFSDWSRSSRRDLRLANDRHYYTDGQEQMFRIAPGEPPDEYTLDDGWQPLQLWGMGIASRDVTGDGYPEVVITSQGDNKLQSLAEGPAEPSYRDIALRLGATAQRPYVGGDVLPSTAWHPEFADVNNDGFVDLFISKGNVEAQPDHATDDPNNLLIGQPDGTFVEGAGAAGIVGFERSRGAALVDLNLDGMLDLVVVNRRENVSLWRNVGDGRSDEPSPMGNWIAVRIRQPGPNTDAIGAWMEIRTGERISVREVTVGGGHAGGQLGWTHAGLGGADRAEVRIRWPDGEIGTWMVVDANRFVTIERGATEAIVWSPDG